MPWIKEAREPRSLRLLPNSPGLQLSAGGRILVLGFKSFAPSSSAGAKDRFHQEL